MNVVVSAQHKRTQFWTDDIKLEYKISALIYYGNGVWDCNHQFAHGKDIIWDTVYQDVSISNISAQKVHNSQLKTLIVSPLNIILISSSMVNLIAISLSDFTS